mmetsp:Transcript_1933/g.2596  ORF Transcript_1933/g.2596 Transcript_1933/m.2596 type:complete len:82 (+) Transcript_1933:1511-1756(+)
MFYPRLYHYPRLDHIEKKFLQGLFSPPEAAADALLIKGIRIINKMPTTNVTRIMVIFRFLHFICCFSAVLFFLKTLACSLS